MKNPNQLIWVICAVLFTGFATSSFVSYHFATKTLIGQIQENNLPLTSDNVYSHVQRDLLSPVLISSLMAQDTFVKDWVNSGESDPKKIINYLKEIQQKYDSVTAFFVSTNSQKYYHSSGILKTVSKDDPQDEWFYNMLSFQGEYQINLEADTADVNRTTFFINHKITDSTGRILGIIGLGLASDRIRTLIDDYQQTFGRTILFVDHEGNIKLHGSAFNRPLNINDDAPLSDVAKQLHTSKEHSLSYTRNGDNIFLVSRLVEPLGWYLLVEETAQSDKNITQALWFNLAISGLMTLLVGWILSYWLRLFQKHINQLAIKDHLTNLASRQGFEPSFHNMLETASRNLEPLSILLLDIDHFKRVNDNYGHLQGDSVLKQIAKILDASVRQCDAIGRWGGEEFIVALAQCDAHSATEVAEKIRRSIEQGTIIEKDSSVVITASVGVAEFDFKESADELFSRADKALYRAKNSGRNQTAQAAKTAD